MDFDYNSTRPKLILAEYGRNVQNMVDYICTLPTKEERNRYAQVVIDMMGVLNPHLRDVSDFKHKLWDHLHIISDFKIDVDSTYPIPNKEEIHHKPELMAYPQHKIRFKHYGFTVEKMIDKAKAMPESAEKEKMVLSIANFMKMAYVTWNKDSVADDLILHDLRELSKETLILPETTVLTKLDFKTPPPGSRVKTQGSASPTQRSGGGSYSNNNNNNRKQNSNPGKKSFSGPKKPHYQSNNKSR